MKHIEQTVMALDDKRPAIKVTTTVEAFPQSVLASAVEDRE